MRPNRLAFTLVELILVLALLVVVAGVTMPLLSGTLSATRLRHSGDLVRAAWGKARITAMQSGEPYVFRCEPNGPRYQIVKLSALTADEAAVSQLPPDDADDVKYSDADILRLALARLHRGVVFASCDVAAVPQLAAVATDGGWSAPIVFYPDGTASDAVVQLVNAEGAALRVTLRGLTGGSRASDIGRGVSP